MEEHHLGHLKSAAKGRPEGSGECVCKAQADVLMTGPRGGEMRLGQWGVSLALSIY